MRRRGVGSAVTRLMIKAWALLSLRLKSGSLTLLNGDEAITPCCGFGRRNHVRGGRRETGERFVSPARLRRGAIATNSATFAQTRQDFGALSGTRPSTELMENYLAAEHSAGATFERALKLALDAWTVGHLALGDAGVKELPARDKILAERKERLRAAGIEAAVLDRDDKTAIRYRALTEPEIRSALGD